MTNHLTATDAGLQLQSLPPEILLEILSFASATSRIYSSLLLVSKQFHRLGKLNCLRVVPIVLEGYEQLSSFDHFLRDSPEARDHVRYLWVMGEGLTCWQSIDTILASCPHIVSLSCTSRSLTSICTPEVFSHTMCTDLTLNETWHAWDGVMTTPHGRRLCAQLTHLRLHEGLNPEFPKQCFKRLTHVAFSSLIKEYLERYLEVLKPLPALEHIVITTFLGRDGAPNGSMSELLDLDERLAVLHCRKGWTELDVWMDGVRGGFSLWDQAKLERKSMKVFHGAFKILKRS